MAHVLYSLCNYILLKTIDAPARLQASGVYMYCAAKERYVQTHSGWVGFLLQSSFLLVLVLFCFVGAIILKSSNIRRRSVLWWCAVLLLGTPLFVSADAVLRIVIRDLHSYLLMWVSIVVVSAGIALVTYFKVLERKERRYLWLVSLPALVVTYFAWYAVMAR